jgi:hypothetical protein
MVQRCAAALVLITMVTRSAVANEHVVSGSTKAPRHTTCKQPLVDGMNVSFWTSATFTVGDSPQVILGMGTGPVTTSRPAGHVPQTLLLSISESGQCTWQQTSATLTDPRTSGCAVAISPSRVMFAGGHNNSAEVSLPTCIDLVSLTKHRRFRMTAEF